MSNFMPQLGNVSEIKVGQIEREITLISVEREQLDRLIQTLETRLIRVLANRSVSTNSEGQSAPEPVRVPLAEQLHEQAFNLSQMGLQLQLIIDRIEL